MKLTELSGRFKRLDIPVTWERLSADRCRGAHRVAYGDDTCNISYYDCKSLYGAVAPSIIAALRPEKICWVEARGPGFIPPHVDVGLKTAINLYKIAGDCDTTLYTPIGDRATAKDPSLNNANIIKLEDVSLDGFFTAHDHESYLLNVGSVHSVTVRHARCFVQLQWSQVDYDTVLQRLDLLKQEAVQ